MVIKNTLFMNKMWHELTEMGCQSIHYLSGSPPKITVADSEAAASKMESLVSAMATMCFRLAAWHIYGHSP